MHSHGSRTFSPSLYALPDTPQVGSNRPTSNRPALPLPPLPTSIHQHQIGTQSTHSRFRGCCRERGTLTLPVTHNDSHQRPVPGFCTHSHVNTASPYPRH